MTKAFIDLTPSELLQFFGLGWKEARFIYRSAHQMYRSVKIPKKAGGERQLRVPNDRLKYLQRLLLPELKKLYNPRHSAHGFVDGRDITTNAAPHIGRRYIVNIDLEDFFGTITENRVYGLLLSLGFSPDSASFLARVCSADGKLPQGAPTSPLLSNMICFKLDKVLREYSKQNRLRYTRYADDLTFSSHSFPIGLLADRKTPAGKLTINDLSDGFANLIAINGFRINERKLHLAGPKSSKRVTGLVINEFTNVPREFLRNLRSAMFKVEKNGWDAAQAEWSNEYAGTSSLQNVLRGRLEWIAHVRGRNDLTFLSLAKRFNALPDAIAVSIALSAEEELDQSIWVIESHEGNKTYSQGTAFFLQDVGLVTAAHCVEGEGKFCVFHPKRLHQKFDVEVVKSCKYKDIALLSHSIPNERYRSLTKANSETKVGDSLRIMGYPSFGPGKGRSTRPGFATGFPIESSVTKIEVNIVISNGLSGAPALNETGAVMGIGHKGEVDSQGNPVPNLLIPIQNVSLLQSQ